MVLLLLVHLLFAQLTFILAVAFVAIGKLSRWRVSWLTVPAVAGIGWTLAIGPAAAGAGLAAGSAQILGYLSAHGVLHIHGAFSGAGGWLPRQLPLALPVAAAEAAAAAGLDWLHTDEWAVPPPRPGLAAAARRVMSTRAIRGGAVIARDGATLGVAASTGAPVGLRWAETAGGVLFTGAAGRDVAATSFQLVHAALRLRKPVIVLDLTGDPVVGSSLTAVCAASSAPLRTFGREDGTYEPFRGADPARRTELTLALLGSGGTGQRGVEACLRAAYGLMAAVPADTRTPVLDDVAHLLNPAAMQARLRLVPADSPLAGQLAQQVRDAARLAEADGSAVTAAARQLASVRGSAAGHWLRSGPDGQPGIDLARVVRERSAVLLRPESPGMARLVCADILALGEDLRALGVDGDTVVLLYGCEKLPADMVTRLVHSGVTAGLPVLATTTSAAAAAGLADVFGALVIHRLAEADAHVAAATLAACTGTRMLPAAIAAQSAYPGADGRQAIPEPGSPGLMAPPPDHLVPQPMVSVRALLSLRTAQFVLAVREPRRRLVELAQAVPARLPRPAAAPAESRLPAGAESPGPAPAAIVPARAGETP